MKCDLKTQGVPETPSEVCKIFLLLTSYLCEAGFYSYTSTKIIYGNTINTEANAEIELSPVQPGSEDILQNHKTFTAFHTFFIKMIFMLTYQDSLLLV